MPLIKLLAKFFAALAVVAVAFGPFGVLQQTPVAQAYRTCSDGSTVYNPLGSCPAGTTDTTTAGTLQDPATRQAAGVNSCDGITGCLASMVYYIGPGFASWVASWSAYFFDLIVKISLGSATYALDFLNSSWSLVLSLANMFFIFILIYAAFTIMLRAETARTMQTLAWVIAIALVVNFSFFFTRIIIDAGNILGTQFYNAVALQNGVTSLQAGSGGAGANTAAANTADITKPLMNAIGVESLLGTQSFTLVSKQLGNAPWSALLVLTVIFLFTAVMFWILAIALLMVGLKFFLRVVGLWLVLVASPLAFVAQTVGSTRHFFTQWLRSLVGLSMYPAVFLFMFWVLNQFANQLAGGAGSIQNLLLGTSGTAALGQAVGAAGSSDNSFTILILIANVSIRMMFIITMLYIMLKVSDWVIEQAGGFATTLVSRGSSMLLGGGFRTAASFGAFAGRNTAGRLAYGAAQSGGLKSLAASSRLGSLLWRGTSALSRSTFDARNAPGASVVGSRLGRSLTNTRDVRGGTASQRTFSQSVDEKAKAVQNQGQALQASVKEVRKLGAESAAEAERRRLEAYVERKGTRNIGNLGLPSWGALKGAAALRKALDKERGLTPKEGAPGDTAGAGAATPARTPTPKTTPPAPAAPFARIVPASDVASNKLTDEERAARLAINPRPSGPAATPAAAVVADQNRQSTQAERVASRTLFMQAQGEQIKKTVQAGAVAASLSGAPNMAHSAQAAINTARAAAAISAPAPTSMPTASTARAQNSVHTETTRIVHQKETSPGTPQHEKEVVDLLRKLIRREDKNAKINAENVENLQATLRETNAKITRFGPANMNKGPDDGPDGRTPGGGVMPMPKAPENLEIPPKIANLNSDEEKKAA